MKVFKFSTPSCGMCKQVSKMLDEKGIEYVEVDCTKEENDALVSAFGICHVPTVIVAEELNSIAAVKGWLAKE